MSAFGANLSIGNLNIRAESDDKRFIELINREYSGFLSFLGENHFTIVLSSGRISRAENDIIVVKKENGYFIKGEGFDGFVDMGRKIALVNIIIDKYVFNLFLRVFYSVILPFYNGFLVHSAGLKKEGSSYILAGRSSSGKTTAARLADGKFRILSDELVIVRRIHGIFTAFATPFPGEFTGYIENDRAALRGLFFLNKKLTVPYAIKSRIENMMCLLENIFFFCSDPESNRIVLNTCNELTGELKGYDINILYHPDFGRIIYEVTEENVCTQS